MAVGSPVLVSSHTADDFKGRVPSFWTTEGRYRRTPAGLGTYGINYPPHYKLRERAISLGNVTENLMQVLRVHCVCTACALHLPCICLASAVHLPCICRASALHLPCICLAGSPLALRCGVRRRRATRPQHLGTPGTLEPRHYLISFLLVYCTRYTHTLARCTRVASPRPSGQHSHRPWPSSTSYASRGLARGGGSRR